MLKASTRCISVGVLLLFWLLVWAPACQSPHQPESRKSVAPVENDAPLTNPYMGWGIWAGPKQYGYNEKVYTVAQNTTGFGDDAPLYDWVMLDWPWRDLEPKEGEFNWKDIDAVMNYWSARGKQFVVRLWVTDDAGWADNPGGPVCPDWLWAKGVSSREYVDEAKSKQRELDYMAPSYTKIYLPALKKFVTAFAGHFDKTGTPIIFVQVVGYGHWVDWATWNSKYPWPSPTVKHELLAKLVELFAENFHHIQLLMSDDGDWDNRLNRFATPEDVLYGNAVDVGISKGAGLIFTGFIEAIYINGWLKAISGQYWRQLPLVGEGYSYDEIKRQDSHGTMDETLRVLEDYHLNFYHFYLDATDYQHSQRDDRASVEKGLKSGGLGYRLALASANWREEVRAGALFLLEQNWVNRNVGRLYVEHPLKLYLIDSQGNEKYSELDYNLDETGWVQGKVYKHISVFHIPIGLASGEYEVRIALVDVSGKPRIGLAIEGADSDKRYRLGTVHVLPPQATH
jgi:hypothetical protein